MKVRSTIQLAMSILILICFTVMVSVTTARAEDAPELAIYEPNFAMLSEGGFGDPQNNYAWCMAMFKDDIYVGTGRNIPYTVGLQLKAGGLLPWDLEIPEITHPNGMPPPPFGPDPDPNTTGNQYAPDPEAVKVWANNMSAEIWRYHHGTWTMVHKASTFVNPLNGYTYPEGTGYRYMITYTDKYGKEALYTGVGIGYGRTLMLKSTNGTTWLPVRFTGATPPYDTRAMAVYNGKLYVGLGSGGIYASDDPNPASDTWVKVADFGNGVAIGALESFNGYLYATTWQSLSSPGDGFEVWRSTTGDPGPDDWVRVVSSGAGDSWNPFGADMESYKGNLYVGSMGLPFTFSGDQAGIRAPKGFDLVRINTNDKWDLIIGNYIVPEERRTASYEDRGLPLSGWPSGFGNPLNLYCWQLEEHEGLFYLTTFDAGSFMRVIPIELVLSEFNLETIDSTIGELETSGIEGDYAEGLLAVLQETNPLILIQALSEFLGGSDMWISQDGVHWSPADLNGLGNPNNYGLRTLVSTDKGLYVGTANPFEGCQVWVGEVESV
jgi:hypothetical protein